MAVASWSMMWFSSRTRFISLHTCSMDRSKAKPVRLRILNCVSVRNPSEMSCNISFCAFVVLASSWRLSLLSCIIWFMIALNHLNIATIIAADNSKKKAAVTAIIPKSLISCATVVTSVVFIGFFCSRYVCKTQSSPYLPWLSRF